MRAPTIIVTALVLTALAGPAIGQVEQGTEMLVGEVGMVLVKSAETGENNDGGVAGLYYESAGSDPTTTFGFGVQFHGAEESYEKDGRTYRSSYSTILTQLRFRYLATPEKRFTPYLGFLVGVRFSGLSRNSSEPDPQQIEDSNNGFVLSVPMGFMWFLGKTVFLDGVYTYNYLANAKYVENNMSHVFRVGVGLKLD
jgi:hypothetical protein